MTAREVTTTPEIDAVLADPTCSTWLKTALLSALDRDCVDVQHDVELLAQLLGDRIDAIQGDNPICRAVAGALADVNTALSLLPPAQEPISTAKGFTGAVQNVRRVLEKSMEPQDPNVSLFNLLTQANYYLKGCKDIFKQGQA